MMEPDEVFDGCLEGTVYRSKQIDECGVHLTVASIHAVLNRGQTDFGGDEHQPCETKKLSPKKRDPDDDYGWWDLESGHYRIRFNESVNGEHGVFLLVPNQRILSCGCVLSSVCVASGNVDTVLQVPSAGISIKENARIALLRSLS